jgi:tetraacyldisaccharide 4'-kinase
MRGKRSIFLYPLSIIWRLITDLRNFMYDSGFLKSHKFNIPVICIGNLSVGGTGKTSHAEYIIDLLRKKEIRVALLSRGYKRKTKGFLLANQKTNVLDIGDEPFQIHRKYPDITVAVDNNRVRGVSRIMELRPETGVIILDDGYQHRRIIPGLSLLLSEFETPVYSDHLLPYGNLRERVCNIRRANIILITKSPEEIPEKERNIIERNLRMKPGQQLFFTALRYDEPVPLFTGTADDQKPRDHPEKGIVLVTGIANPVPLYNYLKSSAAEIIHLKFIDHHNFVPGDIIKINNAWKSLQSPVKYVYTTEKDAVRLYGFNDIKEPFHSSFFYIPVRIVFLQNSKEEFDNLIIDYVRKNKRNG